MLGSNPRGEVSPPDSLLESSASIEGMFRLLRSSGFSVSYHLSVLSVRLSLQVTPAAQLLAGLALPGLK